MGRARGRREAEDSLLHEFPFGAVSVAVKSPLIPRVLSTAAASAHTTEQIEATSSVTYYRVRTLPAPPTVAILGVLCGIREQIRLLMS